MLYKILFEKNTKAIILVANGKGEAREKARSYYGITDATIVPLTKSKEEK